MPILGLGLTVSGFGFLGVTGASWAAGYPIEVALVRGLLAFMAINFVAYVGELIVATAPPVAAEADEDDEEDEPEDEPEEDEETEPVAGVEPGREPIPIRPNFDERQAA